MDSELDQARWLARSRSRDAIITDRATIATMKLISVASDGLSAVVQDVGGALVTVPANPAAVWKNVKTASVLRDYLGRAAFALAPASVPVTPPAEPDPEPEPEPAPPTVVERKATISPVSSGSYWPRGGGWNEFNAGRYGGTSDLYQGGEEIGVGSIRGAAFYGTRLKNLGATKIKKATITLQGNGSNYAAWTAVLQAITQSARPSGNVSPTGPTVSATVRATNTVAADVTALVEGMRANNLGGIALVGSGWGGLYGTSRGGRMALAITYEKET